jgi:chitinase
VKSSTTTDTKNLVPFWKCRKIYKLNGAHAIINANPDFSYLYNNIDYLRERIIVATKNEDADIWNNILLEVLGDSVTYLSSNTISDSNNTNEEL